MVRRFSRISMGSYSRLCLIAFLGLGGLIVCADDTNSVTPALSIDLSKEAGTAVAVEVTGRGWYGPRLTVGFRTVDTDEDFQFLELSAGKMLCWPDFLAFLDFAEPEFVIGVGRMEDSLNQDAYLFTFGPAVVMHPLGDWLSIDVGSRPTLISEDDLGTRPVGGPVQFISHIAARLHLNAHFEVGARLQHMSSAGFSKPNPGVDIVAVDILFRF